MDPKILDQLAQRLAATLPVSMRELTRDIEKNFRAILQNTFIKMNLVTREEFDVQRAVLTRTRLKLEELEGLVKKMEDASRP